MNLSKNHHILAGIGLTITTALILTMATAQTGATDVEPASEEEYDLSITTDEPADVRETEADFQATVNELDQDFDAALVYWNYSQDSNLDQKGPANILLQEDFNDGTDTVESLQPGLDPDTGYDVEAYAEPVVWNDDTLGDNFVEKGLTHEERNSEDIVEDADAMEAVADSSVAMEALADSRVAMDAVMEPVMASTEFSLSSHFNKVFEDESRAVNYYSNYDALGGFDSNIPDGGSRGVNAVVDSFSLGDTNIGQDGDSIEDLSIDVNSDGELEISWGDRGDGNENIAVMIWELDFDDIDEIEVTATASVTDLWYIDTEDEMLIGGNTGPSGTNTETFNVEDLSGEQYLVLGFHSDSSRQSFTYEEIIFR